MDDDDAFGELAYEEDEDIGACESENIAEFGEFVEPGSSGIDGENSRDPAKYGLKKTKKGSKKRSRGNFKTKPPIAVPEVNRRPDMFMDVRNRPSGEKFESIFNSISPLDWHLRIGEEESATKRRRIEVENAVSQASLRILAARMARNQRKSGTGTDDPIVHHGLGNSPQQKVKNPHQLLELPPMDGYSWYGISSTDGSVRRYVSVRRRKKEMRPNLDDDFDGNNADANEVDSYYELVDRIEERRRQRLLKEMEETKQLMEYDATFPPDDGGNHATATLWPDKYAPHNFLDLMTDDETNRLVLIWLRLWEDYVFSRKRRVNISASMEPKEQALIEVEHGKGGQILPKQKILVLYGPSGVGKSSLARIAAKQAGYRPLVLPINEFQNVTELRTRLENATNNTAIQTLFQQLALDQQQQTEKTTLSTNSKPAVRDRPICFIMEGLELASAEIIQFLCGWARRTGPRGIIRRPVICTCASVWQSPALKELRSNSLALRVQRCSRERLQKRLTEICGLERIKMDRTQLVDLVQSHDNDIRLCLNTLQFVTANAKTQQNTTTGCDPVTAPHQPMNTAMSVSMFDVLAALFTLDFHEDNRGIVRPPPQRARALLNLLGQLPQEDFSRLQQLIFVNFISILKLGHGQCRHIVELFVDMDRTHQMVHQGQHFTLARYLPYMLVAIHFVCAIHVSRRLPFNMAALPFNERHRECQQVVRSVRTNAIGGQRFLGAADLTWLLPHLHSILQPPIQATNAHLYSSQEQRLLRRIAQLMHTYRLQYVLKYGPEGGGTMVEAHYCFEPPFDLLTRFPLPQGRRHFSLPEPVKKLIAHQVELASIQAPKKSQNGEDEKGDGEEATTSVDKSEPPLLQKNQQRSQQHFNNTLMGPTFGSTTKTNNSGKIAIGSAGSGSFTFRYSAGSSQAVRRRVLIGDIFK